MTITPKIEKALNAYVTAHREMLAFTGNPDNYFSNRSGRLIRRERRLAQADVLYALDVARDKLHAAIGLGKTNG
jgi:hypothetical protein